MERAVVLYKCRNCQLNFEKFISDEKSALAISCPRCQGSFIREVSRRAVNKYMGCSAGCKRGSESYCPTCPNFGQ